MVKTEGAKNQAGNIEQKNTVICGICRKLRCFSNYFKNLTATQVSWGKPVYPQFGFWARFGNDDKIIILLTKKPLCPKAFQPYAQKISLKGRILQGLSRKI